ncbi:hypothetical protein HDU96_010098 [Phlyctochytrium bullatum]|nr:hypothetical protein HDU96_010098 [Phlyctochytrium bullatum]
MFKPQPVMAPGGAQRPPTPTAALTALAEDSSDKKQVELLWHLARSAGVDLPSLTASAAKAQSQRGPLRAMGEVRGDDGRFPPAKASNTPASGVGRQKPVEKRKGQEAAATEKSGRMEEFGKNEASKGSADELDATDVERLLALKMLHLNQAKEVQETRRALRELQQKRKELEDLRNTVMQAIESGDLNILEDVQKRASELGDNHARATISLASAFDSSTLFERFEELPAVTELPDHGSQRENAVGGRRPSFRSSLTALTEVEEEETANIDMVPDLFELKSHLVRQRMQEEMIGRGEREVEEGEAESTLAPTVEDAEEAVAYSNEKVSDRQEKLVELDGASNVALQCATQRQEASDEDISSFVGHMSRLGSSNQEVMQQMAEVLALSDLRSNMLGRLQELRNESAEEHRLRKEELGLLERKQTELRELRSQLMALRGLGEELQKVYEREEEEEDQPDEQSQLEPFKPKVESANTAVQTSEASGGFAQLRSPVAAFVEETPTANIVSSAEVILESEDVEFRFLKIQEQQEEIQTLRDRLEELQNIKATLVEKQRMILMALADGGADTSERVKKAIEFADEATAGIDDTADSNPTAAAGRPLGSRSAEEASDDSFGNDLAEMERRLDDLRQRQASLRQFDRSLEDEEDELTNAPSNGQENGNLNVSHPFAKASSSITLVEDGSETTAQRQTRPRSSNSELDELIRRLAASSAESQAESLLRSSMQVPPEQLRGDLVRRLNRSHLNAREGVSAELSNDLSETNRRSRRARELDSLSGFPQQLLDALEDDQLEDVNDADGPQMTGRDVLEAAFRNDETYPPIDYGDSEDEDKGEVEKENGVGEQSAARDDPDFAGADSSALEELQAIEVMERQLESTSKDINDSIETILQQVSEFEEDEGTTQEYESNLEHLNSLSTTLNDLLKAREKVTSYMEVIQRTKQALKATSQQQAEQATPSCDPPRVIEKQDKEESGSVAQVEELPPVPLIHKAKATETVSESREAIMQKITTSQAEVQLRSRSASNSKDSTVANNRSEELVTSTLFKQFKDQIYYEAASTISRFEEEPYFLLQLFRNVQKLSSVEQRQKFMLTLDFLASEAGKSNV